MNRQWQLLVILGILVAMLVVFVHPYVNGADGILRCYHANQLAITAVAAVTRVLTRPLANLIAFRPADHENTIPILDLICVRLC